jgi:hypothetical protein
MTHFSDGVRAGRNFANNGTATQPGVFMSPINVYDIVPVALSATAVAAAQAVAAAGNLTINGASAAGGVATLDVPRTLSIVSTGAGDTTQTATITGTDTYGLPMSEAIAFNGTTTVAGKKAFKTVTRVAISAALAGNGSVGSGDIFGFPIAVGHRGYVLTSWAGTFVTTGTFAPAVTTSPATTTTGDVRGTYAVPDSANGSKRLTLWMYVEFPDTQTGLYGVTQA